MSYYRVLIRSALIFSMAISSTRGARVVAQPLLREAPEAEADGPDEAPTGVRAPRGGRLSAEEEQQLRVQQLMEFQRDQMFKAAEEKAASDRMMRYALWTAMAVIALTLLVAFARNRADAPPEPTPEPRQSRGAPPGKPPSDRAADEPTPDDSKRR